MFKIGIDLIEVDRIKKAIERNEGFKEKIFSKKEIEYCETKKNKYESYAARFCAKESFIKAMNISIDFKEFEILNEKTGKPFMVYKGKRLNGEISLSHTNEYAIANVLILE